MLLCCLMTTKVEFGEWLQQQMDNLKIKAVDLERVSGVNKATISRAVNGERMPDPDSLVSLAKGLNIPTARIFEAAGYLPHPSKETKEKEELNFLIMKLTPEDLQEVIDYARHRLEKQETKSGAKKQTSRRGTPARNALIEQ
jgi:transcriptional regulator with XRE-family HTH domain